MPRMNTQVLGQFKTGMDRSSRRGGKDGAQRLWLLQNAYLNERGEAVPRPGLQHVATVTNSAGMYGWQGQLHVFHADDTFVDPANPLVAPHKVPYPLPNAPDVVSLTTVHFVGVILGELYIANEYADGTIRHFWLQNPDAWQPSTIYGLGELVQPTVPNGYYYQAPTSSPVQAWAPSTVYALGDSVQPSTPDGYIYTVVDVTGDNPTSGTTEPVWPAKDGAQVFEGIEETTVPSNTSPPSSPGSGIGPGISDRYNLISGVIKAL